MKKLIIALLALSLLLVSCATVSIDSYDPNDVGLSTTRGTSYEDDLVSVVIAYDTTKNYARVTIKNKTDNFLQLDYNQSSLVQFSESLRIVDGESRKIDSAKVQGNITIAPQSSVTRNIFLTDDISIQDGSVLYLAIVNGDTTHYCTINLDAKVADNREKIVLGAVSDNFTLWHILFLGNTENSVKNRLMEKAIKKYGREDITLENINYEANWKITSLLLYFDMFGYIQKVTADATVVVYE